MNTNESEKTARGYKWKKGNEPSQVLPISLAEGGGVPSGMGEKFSAHPVTRIGSMVAHNRCISLICHSMKNILRAAPAGESRRGTNLSPDDNRFNPRQA